jgi:uncharacterized protein (DUF924 family)
MITVDPTPQEIVEFWFPDGPNPEPDQHVELWMWRMRGGANDAILERYTEVTQRAAEGEFDHWSETPLGRLALIIILDQFPRTVWAGTPEAFSQDERAKNFCLEGLRNGHFDALENVWFKTAFKIPLEHCECPEHLENLDLAVEIADRLKLEAPKYLGDVYGTAAKQPRRHREVIRRFWAACSP